MKKSLFALAAVTAFAGAAQAQSSVTVYGILDVGYIGSNTTARSSLVTTNGGQTKTTFSQLGQNAESTNRLGFKGSEDLGGGKQAVFTAEFYLYPQDQVVSGNTAGGLQNRQTFAGLHQNGVGAATVGLQYTPIFNAAAATSAAQLNNMLGDAVYSAGTVTGGTNGSGAPTNSFTNRVANALVLQSDAFSGLRGNLTLTQNNNNTSQITSGTTQSGGNTNASGWGLGLDYTWKKLYVTAAYQALKQLTTASDLGAVTTTNTVPWTGAQPSVTSSGSAVASNGLNIQDNQTYVGATYDFGILKAYGQYASRKATSTISSDYYVKRSAEQIGVRSFVTPTIEVWGQAGIGRYTSFGSGTPTSNFNTYQLGSNYWLSKRTNLYAIYGQQNYSNFAVGTTTYSSNANNYALGMRHTF